MWYFIAGAMFGAMVGYIICGLLCSRRDDEDCLNCQGILDRDMEIDRLRGMVRDAVKELQGAKFLSQKER